MVWHKGVGAEAGERGGGSRPSVLMVTTQRITPSAGGAPLERSAGGAPLEPSAGGAPLEPSAGGAPLVPASKARRP